MAVNTLHPSYIYRLDDWQKCRNVIEGDKAIKASGEKYVPKLSGQSDPDYLTYLNRVNFTNATARTVDALTGLIFAKDIKVDTPLSQEQLDSITNTKQSVYELAENVVSEVISVGRCGLLVDATSANIETRENGTPYVSVYKSEDIINWKYADNKLSLVVLKELSLTDTDDEFVQKIITNYRVLDLFEGKYRQRLFTELDKQYSATMEVFPTANGKYLSDIPFVCVGVQDLSLEPNKSPILDLVDTNITHFKYDIDRGNALHFVGIPTPYITGHNKEEGESINLGSSNFVCLPMSDAKIGFLELKGEGIGALKEFIVDLVDRMAFLGAKLLKDDKNVGESAQAMELKQNSEKAILASIAKNVSLGIKYALQYYCDFVSENYSDIVFELNTNFGIDKLSPEERKQLMLEWQGNAITYETYFNNMQKGGVISKDENSDDYLSKLETEKPVMSVMPTKQTTTPTVNDTIITDTNNQDSKNIISMLKAKLGVK